MQKRFFLLLFLCLLCFHTTAISEKIILENDAIRFYTPEGWSVVTSENVLANEAFAQTVGTTPQVLKATLDAHNALLFVIDTDGHMLTLKRTPNNTTYDNVLQVTPDKREAFLDKQSQTAVWHDELSAYWVKKTKKEVQGITVHTIAFETLRDGDVYSIENESFDSEPTQEIEQTLSKAAKALLFTGINGQTMGETSLTLPDVAKPVGEAEVIISRDDVPLTIDNAPAQVVEGKFLLTGKTAPNADLRYYVDNKGIERFEADNQGAFEIEIKKLQTGDNTVRIDAMVDKRYGSATFHVILDADPVPMTLKAYEDTCDQDTYEISGITLPNTQLKLKLQSSTKKIIVNKEGFFSTTVKMTKEKDYTYTLEAVLAGYRKNTVSVLVHRVADKNSQLKAFVDDAEKGLANRHAINGKIIDMLDCYGPRLVLFLDETGLIYGITVLDYNGFEKGMQGKMLITLSDTSLSSATPYIVAELFDFIPD